MAFKHLYRLLILLLLLASCKTINTVSLDKNPHTQYGRNLTTSGLAQTGLGIKWQNASIINLTVTVPIQLPYRQTGYFAVDNPKALTFAFYARQGERIAVVLTRNPTQNFTLFTDVWRRSDGYELVAYKEANSDSLSFDIKKSDTLIVRLQPELLVSGAYTITITSHPSLGYPLPVRGKKDIQSFFGDNRDAGIRKHEGVDVFAPKRTPALAVSNGIVTGVNENNLGGKVVWVRSPDKGITLYYAHLDTQLVKTLTFVKTGDTLGLVGNTGNAKYTAPHLHFGIYSGGGAIDPLPFIYDRQLNPKPVTADTSLLNHYTYITAKTTNIYVADNDKSTVVKKLTKGDAFKVLAATANWYYIQAPDGATGFIKDNVVNGSKKPTDMITLKINTALMANPFTNAATKQTLTAGKQVNIYGNYNNFYYVKDSTHTGWLAMP